MTEYIGAIAWGAFMVGFLAGYYFNNWTRRGYHYVPDGITELRTPDLTDLKPSPEISTYITDPKPCETENKETRQP